MVFTFGSSYDLACTSNIAHKEQMRQIAVFAQEDVIRARMGSNTL